MLKTFQTPIGSLTVSGGANMAPASEVRLTGKVGIFSRGILIPVGQAEELAAALLEAATAARYLNAAQRAGSA